MTVESIMRSPPVVAHLYDTVLSVADQMITNNIGAIIITREGASIGVVTERDIVERIVRARRDPDKTLAGDIMSSPIVSIESDKTITDALILMEDKKIRRLAVTKNGKLVGIITQRRLLEFGVWRA